MDDFIKEEERLNELYFSIGMCGCGSPDEIKLFLHNMIKIQQNYKESLIDYQKKVESIKNLIQNTPPNVIFEFVFNILDHNNMVEHGSSINGAWLTNLGEEFFNLLTGKCKSDENTDNN